MGGCNIMELINNSSGIGPTIEGCFRLLIFTASSIIFAIALLSLHHLVDDFETVNLNSFSAVVGVIFGALTRLFQVIVMLILMCNMTLVTYTPFGDYIKCKDKFLAIFRINQRVILSFMMLVGATVKSNTYETYLNEDRYSSPNQGVSRQLRYQQSLAYTTPDTRLLQTTFTNADDSCDVNRFNTAFPDEPRDDDMIVDPKIVAKAVLFSRIALFVFGAVLLLFVTIMTFMRIVTGGKLTTGENTGDDENHNGNSADGWSPRVWHEVDQDYHNRDQTCWDRFRHLAVSLHSLSALVLECTMLVVGLMETDFSKAVKDMYSVVGDPLFQFAMARLVSIIMSLFLFVSIFTTVVKRKKQIVHIAQYAMGVYLLCQATSNFVIYFESALNSAEFKATSDISTDYSLVVTVCALTILLLPILVHSLFAAVATVDCRGTCHQPDEENNALVISRPFVDGLKDFLSFIIANGVSPLKLYRIVHCLSLISGVVSIVSALLAWNSPIASVSVTTGSAFNGLSAGVLEVENQLESLVTALSDMHVSLNPCAKAVGDASDTSVMLDELSSGKNITTVFHMCFDANGDWKTGTHDLIDCDELRAGSGRLDSTIQDRDGTDPSLYNSTFSAEEAVCPIPTFDEPEEPNEVDEKCENIQCGIFFGTMVTLTAAAAVPFVGSGAVFAKVAARVAKKTVLFGRRLGKTAKTINKKRGDVVKAARILKKVAGAVSSLSLYAEYQLLWSLAPVFLIAFFCIFIGFWRRKGLHDVGRSIVLTFICGVLTVMNVGSFLLSFFMIPYLQEILSQLPEALVKADIRSEIGLSLLQLSFGFASLSGICWTIFSALSSVGTCCSCTHTHTGAGDGNGGTTTRANNGHHGERHSSDERNPREKSISSITEATSDTVGGWILASLIISIPVLWLAYGSLVRKDRAIMYGAWNNDDANNVVDAMRGSGVMGKATEIMGEDTASMGCGPVGQTVGLVAQKIFDEITKKLPNFNLSFDLMRGAAATFLSALSGANLFNPFEPFLILPSYSMMEWVLLFIFPILCVVLVLFGTLMMLIIPKSPLIALIRNLIVNLVFVGVQVCISIGGLASVLDAVNLPFFDVRVEWGTLLVHSLIANGVCFIGFLTLSLNALLPVGTV